MTLQNNMKKAKCCGCFDWLFARRARRSPSEDLDSFVEEIKNPGVQDEAGEQGLGTLVCLHNASQPLAVVEEELPFDTQDADGGVEKGGKEGSGKRPQTLIITLHLVKRERANKTLDETTTAVKEWTQESHGQTVHTLIITLIMVKRENIKELPSEDQGTAGGSPSGRGKAVTQPPNKPLKCSLKMQEEPQNTVKKIVRLNFQNLNTFFKDLELYCAYDYFKYGFPLSSIRFQLQQPKERAVKLQKEPPKEGVNKLPEPQKTATEKAADSDKNTQPHHLTGILKKGRTTSTAHKCLRFDFQNLNTFVKDRELYCGYEYFRYGFPLSTIRSHPQKLKERKREPQKGPVQNEVNKRNTLQEQTVREAGYTPMKNTIGGKSPKGILRGEKMPRSTCPKHVRFNLGNLRAPVKERELYRGHDYFRYAAPLEATLSLICTSRLHHQPVRSASNSLRGAPRHLGRHTQWSNDSFQQSSGRNAAHNYTNSRHSQHRQHNSSSYISPGYEPRHFYGQTNPGTNSRTRSRAKRGAKPGGGDFL